jgi:low affinity Fe/Cu permease
MRPSKERAGKRARPPTKSLPEFESGNLEVNGLRGLQWTSFVGQAIGHPAAFVTVFVYACAWFILGRGNFDFNAVATLAVWIMTLLIQRANRRDTLALHAKLDELLRVDSQARSELARLDEKEPEEIELHRNAEVRAAKPKSELGRGK